MSMSVSVSVEGQDKVFADLDADLQKWVTKANQAIRAASFTCQAVAKKNCPVGTPESTGIKGYHGGRLRQSIQVDNSEYLTFTCGTNVYYAIFVHEGTVKMLARPFLRKGFEAGAQQLRDDMGSDI
jgi:HK97 gp10 family phage protein